MCLKKNPNEISIFKKLLLTVTIISCKKDPEINPDQTDFVFGVYNFAFGANYLDLYAIRNGKVYPVNKEQNSRIDELRFSDKALSYDKYVFAKKLKNKFPDYIRNSSGRFVGWNCGGCTDGDIVYVQLTENGQTRSWELYGGPPEVNNYIGEIRKTLDLLR